jgi:hypothetical protein
LEDISRRKFLILIGASGVACIVAACGSGASSYGGGSGGGGSATNLPQGNNNCSDGADTVYTNPGHAHTTIQLPGPQIQAAVPGKYTLLGGDHFHTFQLDAPDFTDLKAIKTIYKMDLEGHGHIIAVTC